MRTTPWRSTETMFCACTSLPNPPARTVCAKWKSVSARAKLSRVTITGVCPVCAAAICDPAKLITSAAKVIANRRIGYLVCVLPTRHWPTVARFPAIAGPGSPFRLAWAREDCAPEVLRLCEDRWQPAHGRAGGDGWFDRLVLPAAVRLAKHL